MGVSRKQSTPNFPKNEHFLPPHTHRYVCVSGGKKCSFFRKFGKFGVLFFLEKPVLRFALLPYYQPSSKWTHLFLDVVMQVLGSLNCQLDVAVWCNYCMSAQMNFIEKSFFNQSILFISISTIEKSENPKFKIYTRLYAKPQKYIKVVFILLIEALENAVRKIQTSNFFL